MTNVKIEFREKWYHAVSVGGLRGVTGEVLIGGERFEDALKPGIHNAEDDALSADELIYFYVPDEMLDKSEDEIRQYVNDNIV